ncbi:MAG: G-D-S-L family lipolytic protein, partial [Marinirhabdus sp.]
MKNYLKITLAAAVLTLMGCEPEFDNPVTTEGYYTAGSADFSTYVAVGNSLTSGYADGALYITGQENSYPNIMAQQFAFVGGGEFTQPLMADNLGGLLLNGTQVASNRLVLAADAMGNPTGPVTLEGNPTTEVTTSANGPFNNMGVPGAKSFHLVTPGYGAFNPFYARFQTSATASILEDAVSLNPSFFTLWIGSNDILGYATSGGSGVDQTGNLDPATYGPNDITDANVFAAALNQQVTALNASASGGVLVNLSDVTSIPYFTTVPAQSIPLDAATAAAVNAQFALYNTQVLPLLVQLQVITQAEAGARMVNFEEGINFPIISDDDLTDLSQILQGPPANLPPPIANLLGQLRQATADDLILLPASSVLGTLANPADPLSVIGVAVPLVDQLVLTTTEQGRVATASAAYNATIQGLAAANDLAYVDARSELAQLTQGGIAYDGGTLTSDYITGGSFSLDGVHPTSRGYAHVANILIRAINAKYGATVPQVN